MYSNPHLSRNSRGEPCLWGYNPVEDDRSKVTSAHPTRGLIPRLPSLVRQNRPANHSLPALPPGRGPPQSVAKPSPPEGPAQSHPPRLKYQSSSPQTCPLSRTRHNRVAGPPVKRFSHHLSPKVSTPPFAPISHPGALVTAPQHQGLLSAPVLIHGYLAHEEPPPPPGTTAGPYVLAC